MTSVLQRWRAWWIGGALTLGALGVIWILLDGKRMHDRADLVDARRHGFAVPVRTVLVKDSPVEVTIGGTVLTTAYDTGVVQISLTTNYTTTGLMVKAVHAKEGAYVRKGDVLMELEDAGLRYIAKNQEMALAAQEASLNYTRMLLTQYPRQRDLNAEQNDEQLRFRVEDRSRYMRENKVVERLKRVNAAPDFDVFDYGSFDAMGKANHVTQEYQAQLARDAKDAGPLSDKSTLATALSTLEATRTNLELTRLDIEHCKVRAPIDGFLDVVSIVPGQVVVAGVQLTQVFQLNPIFARMDFPQERIDSVALGLPAEVVLDSFPNETFPGKVVRINPSVNPALRVIPVVIQLANPDNRIRAGISGYARIKVAKTTTVVPATALIQQGGKNMVFRVEDGRARIRELRTGNLVNFGELEVRNGLKAGDEVVVYEGFYSHWGELVKKNGYLKDNDPVDVNWRKWAQRE